MRGRLGLLVLAACALAGCSKGSSHEIKITGSSTVYPFTKAVADAYVKAGEDRTSPTIESIGTVAGIRRFCAGGAASPDVTDASRRLMRSEYEACQSAKVGEIVEIKIGIDGVALAQAKAGPKLALTLKDIYLALAANPLGKPNTAKTWRDVNPSLPATPIRVFGPPESSGTRDAFVQLLLEPGCRTASPDAVKLQGTGDPAPYHALCQTIRTDGAYVEMGEDFAAIANRAAQDPEALGLIGYAFLEAAQDKLHGVAIDGTAPDAQTIASGKYVGLRSLYLYVKKKPFDAKPDLRAFLKQYVEMTAPNGPLAKLGLIPLPESGRKSAIQNAENGFPLNPVSLP